MRSIKILLSLLIVLFITTCEDKCDDKLLSSGEYLIFGHFYGECLGEGCIEIFKLTNNKLFEDINDIYPGNSEIYSGNYIELDNTNYDLVSDLIEYFPKDLLTENDTVFGCPDCADQGGLYIEYNVDGTHKFWIIDQALDSVPTYLHEFIGKINESIGLINN
jgi:hypothetical protein